jgi:hypothetical protein
MVGMAVAARLVSAAIVAYRENLFAGAAVVVPGAQTIGKQMTIAAAKRRKRQRGDVS